MEWAKDQYNKQYDVWVPWLEDLYLRYFTRDNKASYTTRENLSRTKLTTNPQLNTLQDSANTLVADQLGQDGLGQPVGDLASREGVNRVERKGRDERGGYIPSQIGAPAGGAGEAAVGGGDAVVGGIVAGGGQAAGLVKGAGKGVGGLFGGRG